MTVSDTGRFSSVARCQWREASSAAGPLTPKWVHSIDPAIRTGLSGAARTISAFRFFPVEPDVELGWRLNFWDAATNKTLAFVGRDKVRDWLDVMYLHERHLNLGALVWAAAAKDPGLTPELILDMAKRFSRFPREERDWARLRISPPADLTILKRNLIEIIADAEKLVAKLPPADMGCFYLDAQGRPVCPDPAAPEFPQLTRHFGSVRGAWPRIAD